MMTAAAFALVIGSAQANLDFGDTNTSTLQNSAQKFRGTFLYRNEKGNEVWRAPAEQGGGKYVLQSGPEPYSDMRYYSNAHGNTDQGRPAYMSEQDFDKTNRNSIAIRDPKVAKFVGADTVILTD
jgi:hypothetical protein